MDFGDQLPQNSSHHSELLLQHGANSSKYDDFIDSEEEDGPVKDFLLTTPMSMLYIYFSLLDWNFKSMSTKAAIFVGFYYFIVVIWLISCVMLLILYAASMSIVDEPRNTQISIYLFGITLLTQMISGFVSNIYAVHRLSSKCRHSEFKHYSFAIKSCCGFTSVFIVTGIVGCIVDFAKLSATILIWELAGVVTLTVTTCSFVSSSLLFILVDFQTSLSIIRKVESLAETRQLTVKELDGARQEIERRMEAFSWPNAFMAVNAVVCLVAFLVIMMVAGESSPGLAILSIVWYFKEVAYLFIVLICSARLNGEADRLLINIGTASWGSQQEEFQRMQVCVNLQSKPIAFRLLGMRSTKGSVLWQLISVFIGISIGFVRFLFKF